MDEAAVEHVRELPGDRVAKGNYPSHGEPFRADTLEVTMRENPLPY
jgi:hypothetical protein